MWKPREFSQQSSGAVWGGGKNLVKPKQNVKVGKFEISNSWRFVWREIDEKVFLLKISIISESCRVTD